MERKSIKAMIACMAENESEAIATYEKLLACYINNSGQYVDMLTTGEIQVIETIISEEKGHLLALTKLLDTYDNIPASYDILRRLEFVTTTANTNT